MNFAQLRKDPASIIAVRVPDEVRMVSTPILPVAGLSIVPPSSFAGPPASSGLFWSMNCMEFGVVIRAIIAIKVGRSYREGVTALGVPLNEVRCGKWMRRAQEHCALPENHHGRCRTKAAMARMYARNMERHARVVAERQHLVDEFKMRMGCIDCGYADHPVALDLDHRDPEMKIADVSALVSGKLELLLNELDKCDVRCACCHRIRTHNLHHSIPRRRPSLNPVVGEGPSIEITDHPLGHQQRFESSPPPP